MATISLLLPIAACYLPDDSANNAAARIAIVTSSGGTLHPRHLEALFDASVDEHIFWSFVMPNIYVSTPVLKVYYKAVSATSGTAAFAAVLAAVTDGEAQDVDANAFDTANVGTATVPGTVGYMDVISIALSNEDSLAAGDHVIIGLFRDVSGDSVAGDLEVINVEFQFDDS